MASSSNTPARLRSFHAALARSIASAAAFVSAAENPPVDANGPGARMPTTSSTCRSSPPPRLPLGAPRRSAPATDDAIPRTRDRMPPPDILTGRASERRATHSRPRRLVGVVAEFDVEISDSDERSLCAPVANFPTLGDPRDVVARVLVALDVRPVQPEAHVPAVRALLHLVRALSNSS